MKKLLKDIMSDRAELTSVLCRDKTMNERDTAYLRGVINTLDRIEERLRELIGNEEEI